MKRLKCFLFGPPPPFVRKPPIITKAETHEAIKARNATFGYTYSGSDDIFFSIAYYWHPLNIYHNKFSEYLRNYDDHDDYNSDGGGD
jgi:hypothetical protein